jgi:alpha-galactosidase
VKEDVKITLVGAGSTIFGPTSILSILQTEALAGATLSLVDVNGEMLELVGETTHRMNDYLGVGMEVELETDRTEALPGTDYLLITAEEDRIDRWRRDFEILKEFGIKHTLGENRGPAGLSHTMRTAPLVLDICRDAEELAPEAKGIIFTNPEDRLAYAVNKYTDLEAYGYCDGNWDFRDHFLGELLDLPGEQIHLEGAGINHMVWITELRDRETGKDLYPEMVQMADAENWQPLSRHLYRTYGLWPHENDSHVGEYIGYAPEFNDCSGYDFDGHLKEEKKWRNRMESLRDEDYETERFVAELSDYEHHTFGDASFTEIIKGEITEKNPFLSGANLINRGKIPNLPDDMVVEVPAVVTYSGINGFSFGELPDAIASLTHREGVVQKLSAEAAVEGSREKALRALDLDDIVPDPATGRNLLERFLNEHAEYVRGF